MDLTREMMHGLLLKQGDELAKANRRITELEEAYAKMYMMNLNLFLQLMLKESVQDDRECNGFEEVEGMGVQGASYKNRIHKYM